MPLLPLRPAAECRYDALALGEVMLRLDPGEGRIKTARSLQVWEGGGEYNVARGLRRCFGLRAGLLSAFADNEVGRLLEDLILQGGVDASLVQWIPSDGIGRSVRNGINFVERGFGVRGALGVSDRANTAASQIKPGDFDWDTIFGKLGARWFHTGGVFAALSGNTAEATLEAMTAARRHGVIISYDLNYRASLWQDRGGKAAADALNRQLLPLADVLIGVEVQSEAISPTLENFKKAILSTKESHPNLQVIATTMRHVKSATLNDWAGLCWAGGKFYESRHYDDLEILDRIGGGDSFASGLIYGLMTSSDPQDAVDLATAHGALAMTTPGDTSMASLAEVKKLAGGSSAKVER